MDGPFFCLSIFVNPLHISTGPTEGAKFVEGQCEVTFCYLELDVTDTGVVERLVEKRQKSFAPPVFDMSNHP